MYTISRKRDSRKCDIYVVLTYRTEDVNAQRIHLTQRMSMPRFFIARMARMVRCRQVDGTILLCTNGTNGTMSTSRRHDFNPHEWHERYDVDKSTARFFFARIARYRQVDDTIFMAREGNRSCIPLAEIVFFRVFRAEKIVSSACGNRVLSCLSCRKNRAGRIVSSACGNRVLSCLSCRKNRAFRLRKTCRSCKKIHI